MNMNHAITEAATGHNGHIAKLPMRLLECNGPSHSMPACTTSRLCSSAAAAIRRPTCNPPHPLTMSSRPVQPQTYPSHKTLLRLANCPALIPHEKASFYCNPPHPLLTPLHPSPCHKPQYNPSIICLDKPNHNTLSELRHVTNCSNPAPAPLSKPQYKPRPQHRFLMHATQFASHTEPIVFTAPQSAPVPLFSSCGMSHCFSCTPYLSRPRHHTTPGIYLLQLQKCFRPPAHFKAHTYQPIPCKLYRNH